MGRWVRPWVRRSSILQWELRVSVLDNIRIRGKYWENCHSTTKQWGWVMCWHIRRGWGRVRTRQVREVSVNKIAGLCFAHHTKKYKFVWELTHDINFLKHSLSYPARPRWRGSSPVPLAGGEFAPGVVSLMRLALPQYILLIMIVFRRNIENLLQLSQRAKKCLKHIKRKCKVHDGEILWGPK